jgi:hypothetical protein
MPRLPVSCARSPRVATLCRAPSHAAMLGWPGLPWLGRGQLQPAASPALPCCPTPHVACGDAAAAIVTSCRVRALQRLRLALMVLRVHAPQSPWLVALARVSLDHVVHVSPTGVTSSPNSSLFLPCRHDCLSHNIKSAGRSHLGPLHRVHSCASNPVRQPAPPCLDWRPVKLQFRAFCPACHEGQVRL